MHAEREQIEKESEKQMMKRIDLESIIMAIALGIPFFGIGSFFTGEYGIITMAHVQRG